MQYQENDQPVETSLEKRLDELKAGAEPAFAARLESPEAFREWRKSAKEALCSALGLSGKESAGSLPAKDVGTRDRGELQETKIYIDRSAGVRIPVYRLRATDGPRHKGRILVFHGHNPNVQYCLGNYPDAETEARMRAKDNHYAEGLAREGWEVFAVEQQGFGERQTARRAYLHDGTIGSSCRDLSLQYVAVGKTLLGERVRDGMAVLDFLESGAEAGSMTGVTGNSGGGTTALWLAALDERVDVCVPGSYLCRFRDSIYAVPHCDCNYVPGILNLFEMGDIAALVAPRPFCAIHGERDPIFPVEGTRAAFATVQAAYDLLQKPGHCRLALHEGAHAYRIAEAVDWFGRFSG